MHFLTSATLGSVPESRPVAEPLPHRRLHLLHRPHAPQLPPPRHLLQVGLPPPCVPVAAVGWSRRNPPTKRPRLLPRPPQPPPPRPRQPPLPARRRRPRPPPLPASRRRQLPRPSCGPATLLPQHQPPRSQHPRPARRRRQPPRPSCEPATLLPTQHRSPKVTPTTMGTTMGTARVAPLTRTRPGPSPRPSRFYEAATRPRHQRLRTPRPLSRAQPVLIWSRTQHPRRHPLPMKPRVLIWPTTSVPTLKAKSGPPPPQSRFEKGPPPIARPGSSTQKPSRTVVLCTSQPTAR